MTLQIPVHFIDQLPQKSGYQLIRLRPLHPLDGAIGTRVFWHNHQAWLFQQQTNEWLMLSQQAWPLSQKTDIELLVQQTSLDGSAQNNQLWLGTDLSQAAVFDAAKRWQQIPQPKGQFVALLHTTTGFAFQPHPAKFMMNLSPQAIGASPLLEDYGIANRLASDLGLPGCHDGDLVDLYQAWLSQNNQAWQVLGFLPESIYQACFELSQAQANLDFKAQAY